MDTVAAITGGVVAAHTGARGIPAAWLAAREPLPDWTFTEPGSVRPAPAGESRLKPLLLPRPCPVPDLVWTDEQWQRVRSGRIPGDLDGRWEFYTSEGVLHLHRSWTGLAIWNVRVAPVKGGGWRPVSALVEAYPEHYTGEPEVPRALLRLLAGDYGRP